MGLNYYHLNDEIRGYMLEEFNLDHEQARVFRSPRLTHEGLEVYPEILRQTLQIGTDDSLASQLVSYLKTEEQSTSPKTKLPITKAVPKNAHSLLAEGEFNRYYIRGLCRYAIEHGIANLEVFRAKLVDESRSRSSALIGQLISPQILLDDLRTNTGDMTPVTGIPGGPNSGISVRIPT